jgi:hypothetical protein
MSDSDHSRVLGVWDQTTERTGEDMYTETNYRTKKALKEAVAAGVPVRVYQPGIAVGPTPDNGTVHLEGPHYPEPHRWYAQAELREGVVVKVK